MLNSQRQRRSIFGTEKPKSDDDEPKILLNGDTFSNWNVSKPAAESMLEQPANNSVSQITFTRP